MSGRPGGDLALDLATVTGWAYGHDGDYLPSWGTWRLRGVASAAESFVGLENMLTDFIELNRPRRVIYEAALTHANRPNNANVAMLLIGLATHVESTCYRCDVECLQQDSSTVRAGVLGKGTFRKPLRTGGKIDRKTGRVVGDAKDEVEAFCIEYGWGEIDDHNARDAACLWRFTTIRMRHPTRALIARDIHEMLMRDMQTMELRDGR